MNEELLDQEALLKMAGWDFREVDQKGWAAIHSDTPPHWVHYVHPSKCLAVHYAWQCLTENQNG